MSTCVSHTAKLHSTPKGLGARRHLSVARHQPQISVRSVAPNRSGGARRTVGVTQASLGDIGQLAEEVGTVDAPIWVVVAGAIAITVVGSLFFLVFQPGTDAAEKMQERDKDLWNK